MTLHALLICYCQFQISNSSHFIWDYSNYIFIIYDMNYMNQYDYMNNMIKYQCIMIFI
jgi:hypothetical protein